MSTWRAISSTIGRSESLAAVSSDAERLYFRMLATSDSYGRLDATPAKLRVQTHALLNWTSDHVGELLFELIMVDRIHYYNTPAGPAIAIIDFERHQPVAAYQGRGKPKIPAPEPDHDRNQSAAALDTQWASKNPAKHNSPTTLHVHHGGTPPPPEPEQTEHSAKSPQNETTPPHYADTKRLEERKEEYLTQQQQVARETADETDAAAELAQALDAIGLTTGELRARALRDVEDHPRLLAWARLAAVEATRSKSGFFLEGMQGGEWPSVREKPAASSRASNVQAKDPVAAVTRMLANGVFADEGDLVAELDGYGISGSARDRLLEVFREGRSEAA